MKKTSEVFLKKGDVIDIVAPASSSTNEELQHAVQWLTDLGYQPRVPKDILQPVKYLANTDQKRFSQLKQALTNKTSKVVWCLRGGYGSLRLVPELLKLKKQSPKMFIGLSDITVLHQFLNQKWGWKTIHGPILARSLEMKNKRPQDYQELFGLLTGEKSFIQFENLQPLNPAAIKNKKNIQAKIRGGNLCTFCSLLGTPLQPKVDQSFLFFEDTGERGYKVDRMLTQLEQAGIFKKCKGVFFGDMIKGDEADGTNLVWSAIEDFFKKYSFPVYKGIESDHSEKQRPLFLNSKAELIYNKQPTLKVYSS